MYTGTSTVWSRAKQSSTPISSPLHSCVLMYFFCDLHLWLLHNRHGARLIQGHYMRSSTVPVVYRSNRLNRARRPPWCRRANLNGRYGAHLVYMYTYTPRSKLMYIWFNHYKSCLKVVLALGRLPASAKFRSRMKEDFVKIRTWNYFKTLPMGNTLVPWISDDRQFCTSLKRKARVQMVSTECRY